MAIEELVIQDLASTLIVLTAFVGVYFFPTIVAWRRRVPHAGSVTVINLFLGWTFLGWVIALAMAVRSNRYRSVRRAHSGAHAVPYPVGRRALLREHR